jgi:2-polyprenyl-3-methyl-5-hydroxy-6-metoxy-1,4-benzoquinol methylase
MVRIVMSENGLSGADIGRRIAEMVINGATPGYGERLGFWSAVWDELAPEMDARPPAYAQDLIAAARIGPGMRVLDLGAGPGSCTALAGELVGPDGLVTGIDISAEMLRRAQVENAAPNISYRNMNAERLVFADGSFDVVLSSMMIMTVSNPDEVLHSVSRVLAPGGRFAMATLVPGAGRRAVLVPLLLDLLPPGLADGLRFMETAARVAALSAHGFAGITIARRRYPVLYRHRITEVEETRPVRSFLARLVECGLVPDLPEQAGGAAVGAEPDSAVEFTTCAVSPEG